MVQVLGLNHREASSLAPHDTLNRKPRLEARFVRTYRELQDAQCLRAALFGAEFGIAFPDRIDRDPCWDPAFNCADVLVLLEVNAVADRYAQRFLKAG